MLKKILNYSAIVILLFLLAGLTLFIVIDYSFYSGKGTSVTIKNQSGQSISSMIVSVSGKSCSVKNLENHGEINCYFSNLTDSSYSVDVVLNNGALYKAENLGYVTGGVNFSDTIIINEMGEINLAQSSST